MYSGPQLKKKKYCDKQKANNHKRKATNETTKSEKMKNITYILLAAILLASCGAKETDDLAGKKKQLAEKKSELKALQSEIDLLREEILVLEPPREKAPVLIKSEAVQPVDFERYTDVQASLASDDVVFASSEMGGRIVTMTAKEGQYLQRGALVATVDLQTLKDQKAELETGMSLAKDVYDRQKRLWDQKIGSEIQYLQAKNGYERLQKSLEVLNTQIKKANVYAPISGVVDKEFLQAGEMSAPGAPIIQIFNPNKLKITADVPETYLGKIRKGDKVKVSYPALGIEVEKRISLVGRTIDPSNRTFKVEVNTDNMGGKLKPNLLAEISFNDYSQKDAIAVELPLIQEEVSGKKYVYTVANEGGKTVARKKYVEIGESSEGNVIVSSGLAAGDKIITDGARSVSEGALVKELTK